MQVADARFAGTIEWREYATHETAIVITRGIETVMVATVHLSAWGQPDAPEGRVWLKTWGGHAGIDRALVEAGVVERFDPAAGDVEAWGGYGHSCRAVLMRLTPAALADLSQAMAA